MTMTPLDDFLIWPRPTSPGGLDVTGALTSNNHKQGMVFYVPVSGTLSKVAIHTGAVTVAADLRIRVETVTTATGFPSGTTISGNASDGAVVSPTANTTYEVPLTTPLALTRGQLVAVLVDAPSGAPNLIISRYTSVDSPGIPYGVVATTGALAVNNRATSLGLYLDGNWIAVPNMYPYSALGLTSFGTGTTPNERGNFFTLPFGARVVGLCTQLGTVAKPHSVQIYDSSGTVMASGDRPDNNSSSAGIALENFDASVDLPAGFQGRMTIKPTTATVVSTTNGAVETVGLMAALPGGAGVYRTTRKDAGAWTNVTTGRESVALLISHIDTGTTPRRFRKTAGGLVPA